MSDNKAFTNAAKAFGAYVDERGGPDRPWMHHEAWAAATRAILAFEQSTETETQRLRAALRQVIVDCKEAGNLSYAARTAADALGPEGAAFEAEIIARSAVSLT